MVCWGDYLCSFFGGAKKDALIVAPFIRSSVLAKLLASVHETVQVTVVTRWRPVDIVTGASDLGVFDLTESNSVPLFLRNDLHAKLFAADDQCLVGSANVTATALGWRSPSNLELLVPILRSSSQVEAFLKELMTGSVRATKVHREHLQRLVEQLASSGANMNLSATRRAQSSKAVEQLASSSELDVHEIADDKSSSGVLPPTWVPKTMNPEELYAVYTQGSEADIGTMILPGMLEELSNFGLVPGMSESQFKSWIASSILQTPLVVGVLNRIESKGSISETTLAELFTEIGVELDTYSPRDSLKILQRWLSFFLSSEYETTPESIKLIKTTFKNIDLGASITHTQRRYRTDDLE